MNKPKHWLDRVFRHPVTLVLLGFFLGLFGACFGEHQREKARRHAVAKYVRASISVELRESGRLIEILREAIAPESRWDVSPSVLDWRHDPSVPMAIGSEIGVLHPEVLTAYASYIVVLEQCRNRRDIFAQKLEEAKGARPPKGEVGLYVKCIKFVIDRGRETIQLLDKHYPNTKGAKAKS